MIQHNTIDQIMYNLNKQFYVQYRHYSIYFGEDGQTSGIIGHAGQLPHTFPESLKVSLPVKLTLSVLFYLPISWARS